MATARERCLFLSVMLSSQSGNFAALVSVLVSRGDACACSFRSDDLRHAHHGKAKSMCR